MNRRHLFSLLASAAALSGLPASLAFAAGDPKPEAVLASLLGEWQGTFSSSEGGAAQQPTKLFVSLIGPEEVALYFEYDAGAGKTDYGYERLRFEFASDTLIWITGAVERRALVGRIVASSSTANLKRYVIDTTKDGALTRYTFEFSPSSFTLSKDHISAAGKAENRSRYSFHRPA